jgi:hypothetical protein
LLLLSLAPLNGAVHGKVLYYDNTFAPGTEPDGFDGIKWGTDIATLDPWKNMELLTKVGLSTYYKRKKADLTFGLAHLDEIIYEFWDGKFAGVVVRTTGYSNYIFLKEYCFKRFGPGDRTRANEKMAVQDFFWNGYETRMTLTYSERYRTGEVRLVSIKMENQRRSMRKLGTQGELKDAVKQ